MIEISETRTKRRVKRFIPLTFELLAVVFFIASCCQGAPIRDNNKPNGFVGRWRKSSWKPRAGAEKNKDTDNSSNDIGGFLSPSTSFFNWEAFIHGPTGVASSNERSGPFALTTGKASRWPLLRKKTSHTAAVVGDSDSFGLQPQEEQERKQRMVKEEDHLIVETSRQFVNTWSDFLCQGSISFGILRCMKEKSNKEKKRKAIWQRQMKKVNPTGGIAAADNSQTVSSSSLLARFVPLPVKLLEFGKIVESSPSSVDNHGDNVINQKGLIVLGSWDIPLQGGSLLLEDDESGPDYRGKLMFAIARKTQLPDEDQSDDSIESCRNSNSYQIITGIRDYRPWLAGGGYTSKSEENKTHDNVWDAIKANRETTTRKLCHGFYLSTQSMVHAYVTWRFHSAWRQQLATTVRTTRTTAADKENQLHSSVRNE
jgi:hypothetical protein